MGRVLRHLLEEGSALGRAPPDEKGAAEPDAREVGLRGGEARERHRAQHGHGLDRLPRGEEGDAAVEQEPGALGGASRRQVGGEGGETRPGLARRRGSRMLAVEPVEGGRRASPVAAREAGPPELEESVRSLARAGRGDLLERAGQRGVQRPSLPEESGRAREGGAGDGAGGLEARGEERQSGLVGAAQGLLRAAEGEERVVAEERSLHVGVRQLGDGIGGTSQVEKAQAGSEAGETGDLGAGEAIGHGGEGGGRRGAVPKRRLAKRGLGGVARLGPEAPVGALLAGRCQQGEKGEGREQDGALAPYMGPRALASPPARIRTSSSWK